MGFVKDVAIAWIAGRQSELGSITVDLIDASDSSIVLSIDDKLVQIVVPSSFHIEECGFFPASSSDEVFLVTSGGAKSDEAFDNMLMMVNEKLERVAIQPDALAQVLDHLLVSFQKYKDRRGEKSSKGVVISMNYDECDVAADSDDDCNEDYGYDLATGENVSSKAHNCTGFLYEMVQTARAHCDSARGMAGLDDPGSPAFNHNDVLKWCIVSLDPNSSRVFLIIHVGGIVRDGNLALALGLLQDMPIRFSLAFDEHVWAAKCRIPMRPLKSECKVTQESATPWMNSGEDSHKKRLNNYGTDVLLPKLVQAFFHYLVYGYLHLEDKAKSRDLYDNLHEFTSMDNTFIGLLCFICARIRALPDWCVVCWDSLPYSVYRLRTCNKDLCLFTFEELGVGTFVLPELQTYPELVDFELSLALVAAGSLRDVFEPFPSFLLEKEEIRGRSGFFSKKERVDSGKAAQQWRVHKSQDVNSMGSNKNLHCLKSILQSYPPLSEMQSCRNEFALMSTLNRFWMDRQTQTLKGKRPEELGAGCGGAKLKCLPHSVLRYVLFTSRLKLKLLEGQEKFPFFYTYYQFAVLHDSPEREASFEARRVQQKGSFFAFHGSSVENWYSILRNGLRCLSNTKLMSCGAAYGSGIYLAGLLSVSSTYAMFGGPGWCHGHLKDGFRVMAICEVINGSIRGGTAADAQSQAHLRDIMVVPPEHEEDVAIRYILVLREERALCQASIRGTNMEGRSGTDTDIMINLAEHYQGVRSTYGRQQDEQRSMRRVEHFQSISFLSQEMRERSRCEETGNNNGSKSVKVEVEHLSTGSSSVAVPANVKAAISVNKAQVDHSTPGASLLVNVKAAASSLGGGASTSAMKAIAREYKNIVKQMNEAKMKRSECPDDDAIPILAGLEVTLPDETNISRWHVNLSQLLFKTFPLYKDLAYCAEQWKVQEVPIKLECMFPETFPFSPPFVRVISPRFSFHTGHVTVGGSICMELLTESGWSPACSFESLIVQIVSAIVEGGGRLDRKAARIEYSEREARQAFDRVARDHGWMR